MSPTREENAIVTLAGRPSTRRPAFPRASGSASASIRTLPRAVESWIICALLLWLLVGPRVELSGFRGLRVEDLVFGALAGFCLIHHRLPRRPAATTVAIIAVALTGLLSAAIASMRGMVDPLTSVLYAVRPAEYWIAFPAALLLLRAGGGRWVQRTEGLLVIVTVLQTAFAVLQYYFGLPWGFSHAAYTRAAGLTVGPYELGAIAAMLVVFWVSRGRWAMASLAVIALSASISRISILGAVVAVAVFAVVWTVRLVILARQRGWRSALRPLRRGRLLVAGQAASVVAAGVVLAFTAGLLHLPEAPAPSAPAAEQAAASSAPAAPTASDGPADEPSAEAAPETAAPLPETPVGPQVPEDSITQRLATTSVLGSWNAAEVLASRVPHPASDDQYQFAAYAGLNIYVNANTAADSGLEASNLIRFYRWHLILDTFDDPVDVIFGLGPSFVGPSVDGSYLRMFADGGLLGVLAWTALIVVWLRRRPLWMVCVTISLLIGGVFIDIVYAQRPMVLFWLLLAVAAVKVDIEREAPRTARPLVAEEATPRPGTASPVEILSVSPH